MDLYGYLHVCCFEPKVPKNAHIRARNIMFHLPYTSGTLHIVLYSYNTYNTAFPERLDRCGSSRGLGNTP